MHTHIQYFPEPLHPYTLFFQAFAKSNRPKVNRVYLFIYKGYDTSSWYQKEMAEWCIVLNVAAARNCGTALFPFLSEIKVQTTLDWTLDYLFMVGLETLMKQSTKMKILDGFCSLIQQVLVIWTVLVITCLHAYFFVWSLNCV